MRRRAVRVFFPSVLLPQLILAVWPATAEQPGVATPSPDSFPPSLSTADIERLLDGAQRTRPRLLGGPDDWAEVRLRVAADARAARIAQAVLRDAEGMLDVEPVQRQLQGRRLLGQSRRVVRRLLTLATAFQLTQDERFAARGRRELLAVAEFEDWNPSHYLDVAEMTFAVAIGYDWLHTALDEECLQQVERALLAHGVRVPLDTDHRGWTGATNNWGQVCHAGMVAGALAVMESDRDAAVATVQSAVENIPRSMAMYAPRGSYPEGPGYWSYGTTYNVILIDLLQSVLGTSCSLEMAPGFEQTGQYPALMTGPSGRYFNYADGGDGRGSEPALEWFAARFGRPDWLWGEQEPRERVLTAAADGDSAANRFFPLLLLWMSRAAETEEPQMPLHWMSGGKVPVSVHRTAWTDPAHVYVGFKAGSPSGPHGQMDVGSFVMDADGVRWAVDLGAENYHRIESRGMNFWSSAQNSDRWKVFRQSNHSHNTLVIDGQLQRSAAHAPMVRFSDDSAQPHSVADLTEVYREQATRALRSISLTASGEVLVEDRLEGLRAGTPVRWGMVTRAEPGAVGGESIELRQGALSLTLRWVSQPFEGGWRTVDTSTPRNEWDSPNPGTVMVACEATAPASGRLDLAVLLTPGSRPATPKEQLALGQWFEEDDT